MTARGPMPPRHHEVSLARLTCTWADGSRNGCGNPGHKAYNVPGRPGRVFIFCVEHVPMYDNQRAIERADRREGEASGNGRAG